MAPAGRFPLFRLGTLLARQLSKPVADKIKQYAVDHPWFRRTVCVRTGRVFYTLQLRLRMWTLALRQPLAVPPLSEQAALSCGAEILDETAGKSQLKITLWLAGEAVVFALGGLIVIFEVNRQAGKQEDKLLDDESRRLALLLSLEELRRELALQQRDIDRLQAALQHLAPQHYGTAPRTKAPVPPTLASTPQTPENPTAPTSASPTPPTLEGSTPLESPSPTSTTSASPTPPTLEGSTPLESPSPTPTTSASPTPSTSEGSIPLESPSPTSTTSEFSAPPMLDSSTPPESDCSIPPITEFPPPPISDYPPSET